MVWTVLYEFVIYSVACILLPSILRKIVIVSFFITALSIVFVILELVHYYHSDLVAVDYVIEIIHSVSQGLLVTLLVTNILELVCASSIQHERIVWRLDDICDNLFFYYQRFCSVKQHIIYGVRVGTMQSAWIHPVLPPGHWYKKRVKYEDYTMHTEWWRRSIIDTCQLGIDYN